MTEYLVPPDFTKREFTRYRKLKALVKKFEEAAVGRHVIYDGDFLDKYEVIYQDDTLQIGLKVGNCTFGLIEVTESMKDNLVYLKSLRVYDKPVKWM